MDFEQRRAGVDRRTHAEAGDAAENLAADRRPDRVDAEGEPIGRLERQIGGRDAELAAEPLAAGDDPGDDVVAAEAARRRLDVAALERATDRRRRNNLGAAVDRRLDLFDDLDRETEPRPGADEIVGRAAARAAEAEVPADHDRADAEPRDQRLFDEFLRRQAGQRGVEGQRRRAGEAERAEDARLDRQRRQAKDDRPAGEIVGRMRLEGEDGGGRAPLGGERQGAAR